MYELEVYDVIFENVRKYGDAMDIPTKKTTIQTNKKGVSKNNHSTVTTTSLKLKIIALKNAIRFHQ